MPRPLLLILVLAVGLRLAFSLGVARPLLHLVPDREATDTYHLIAENLYHGFGYRQFAESPETVQRPPGYPLFLFLLFQLFGVNYVAVQVAQAMLGAAGCWLLYSLGRWILDARLGLVAAALYAAYPVSVIYAARLYAENLYYPLFFAFAWMLCRAATDGSARLGFVAGGLWGLSLLTRGTLAALPLALPFAMAFSRRHRTPRTRWLRWSLPALLAGGLVLAPWTARNFALTGSFIPVSTWGWAPFYHGLQCAKGMLGWQDLKRINEEAEAQRRRVIADRLYGGKMREYESPRDYVHHEEVARSLVLDEIRANPTAIAFRSLVGIPFAWFQTYGARLRVASLAFHLPLMAFFGLGVLRLRRAEPAAFRRAWPALALILFVNLLQAVVFPHVRYMSPAVGLSFVFAALPIAEWVQRRKAM